MSAYVPPWKRKAAEAAASTPPPEAGPSTPLSRTNSNGNHTIADVLDHLGGRRMGTINVFSYPGVPAPKKTVKELIEEEKERERRRAEKAERSRQRWLEKQERANSTSNPEEDKETDEQSSAPTVSFQPPPHPYSHLISWIHFMPAAHPRFSTDQELWFHTNSSVVIDTQENLHRPIPIFGRLEEMRGPRKRSAAYSSRTETVTFLGYWCVEGSRWSLGFKTLHSAVNSFYLVTM
jgi:hypothetical protein